MESPPSKAANETPAKRPGILNTGLRRGLRSFDYEIVNNRQEAIETLDLTYSVEEGKPEPLLSYSDTKTARACL